MPSRRFRAERLESIDAVAGGVSPSQASLNPPEGDRLPMGAKAGVGALGLVLLAILVFLAVSSWSRQPAGAKPSIQPINFPHRVHVQTYKIDCQYCHSDARRSGYAGLPTGPGCQGGPQIPGAR